MSDSCRVHNRRQFLTRIGLAGSAVALLPACEYVTWRGKDFVPFDFDVAQPTFAALAKVMEKGLAALPHGALQASVVAILIGVGFELLLAVRKRNDQGELVSRFWWVPIPSALGFALILPAPLNLGIAVGSVISAVWARLAPGAKGSFELYGAPLASGLVAGEAMVGAILLPALAVAVEWLHGLMA